MDRRKYYLSWTGIFNFSCTEIENIYYIVDIAKEVTMAYITSTSRLAYIRILKLFSCVIGFILTIGCRLPPSTEQPLYGVVAEYGMPYADYRITGSIKASDTFLGIEGVKVSLRDTGCACVARDSALTDSAGAYALEFGGYPGQSTWSLTATDVDDAANGSFAPKDSIVSIPQSDLTGGDGSWYSGRGEKNVDLNLDRTN
jgi:putative lipoprotein (rSAM/lipoprotein system)